MSLYALILSVIVAVIVYIIAFLVIKKRNTGNKFRPYWRAALPAISSVPFTYFAGLVAMLFAMLYYPSRDFDKHSWLEQPELRYEMSQEMINSEMLLGKSMEEVVLILGEGYFYKTEEIIKYELGYVPGFIILDPDILSIEFDNGVVVRVRQHGS